MTTLVAILGSLFTLTGVVVAALIASRSNSRSVVVQFSQNVVSRLAEVERQLQTAREETENVRTESDRKIEEVRTQLTMSQKAVVAAVRFIDRLVEWGRAGGTGKMPTPPNDLHEYLDPDMWGAEERPPGG